MQILDIDAGSGIGAGSDLSAPFAGPASSLPQGDSFASLVDLVLARHDGPPVLEAGPDEAPRPGEPAESVVVVPVLAVPIPAPPAQAWPEPAGDFDLAPQVAPAGGVVGGEPFDGSAGHLCLPVEARYEPATAGAAAPAVPAASAPQAAESSQPTAAARTDRLLAAEPARAPLQAAEVVQSEPWTAPVGTILDRPAVRAVTEHAEPATDGPAHAYEAAGDGGSVDDPGAAEPRARPAVRPAADPMPPSTSPVAVRVRSVSLLPESESLETARIIQQSVAPPGAAPAAAPASQERGPQPLSTPSPAVPAAPIAASAPRPAADGGTPWLQNAASDSEPAVPAGDAPERTVWPAAGAAVAGAAVSVVPAGPSSGPGHEAASRPQAVAVRPTPDAIPIDPVENEPQTARDARTEVAFSSTGVTPAASHQGAVPHALAVTVASVDSAPDAAPGPMSVPAAPGVAEPSPAAPVYRLPAPYAGPTPVDDRENVHTIVRSIRVQAGQEQGSEARLQLRPEHLGQVAVTIRVEQGAVTAHLHAESPQAQRWIEGHQQELRTSLREQGLEVRAFVVTTDPDRREQRREGPARERQPRPRKAADPNGETPRFEVRV